MNTIDKEIEDFKKNLVTIDELSKNIKNTNEKNEKVLKEVIDVEKLKQDISNDLETIVTNNEKTLNKIVKLEDNIKKLEKQAEDNLQEIEDLNKKIDKYFIIQGALLVIVTILLTIIAFNK